MTEMRDRRTGSSQADKSTRTDFEKQLLLVNKKLDRLNDCMVPLIGRPVHEEISSVQSNCSIEENLMGTLEAIDQRLQDLIREFDGQTSTSKVSETSEICDATGERRA